MHLSTSASRRSWSDSRRRRSGASGRTCAAGTTEPASSSTRPRAVSQLRTDRTSSGRYLSFSSAGTAAMTTTSSATRTLTIPSARWMRRMPTHCSSWAADASRSAAITSGFAGSSSCARSEPVRAHSACSADRCSIPCSSWPATAPPPCGRKPSTRSKASIPPSAISTS